MPVVRHVAFYPATGFADRPWHADPACDAVVKSGRRVAELYSQEISRLALDGKASEVRVFLDSAKADADAVTVEVHREFVQGFEVARASVPAAAAGLSPRARAETALEVLTTTMEVLALDRGWDPSLLAQADAACRGRDLEFAWSSPWKASANRRWEARATFWLADHGYGRTVLEARPRDENDAVVVRSAPAEAFCTAAGFERSARTLRWNGDKVTMTPNIGLVGNASGRVELQPAKAAPSADWTIPTASGEGGAAEGLQVRAVGTMYVPDAHEIRFVGGGPMNGVPSSYRSELRREFTRLTEEGAEWWSAADRTLLQIQLYIDTAGPDQRVVVRRLRDRVTVQLRRRLDSLTRMNARRAARDDVQAVAHAVTARMGLGHPPGR